MAVVEKLNSGSNKHLGVREWAFAVFLGIMVLHGVSILLFTRGFLLTRSELSQYSQCEDVAESPCFSYPHERNANGSCWTKPAVDRLVIIVLDALRFDFVAPSTYFTEKKHWMDRLQVLHELASQNQSSSRIFKAIADPPTTSLQRLKIQGATEATRAGANYDFSARPTTEFDTAKSQVLASPEVLSP